MNDSFDQLEQRLRAAANELPFPPTPDFTRRTFSPAKRPVLRTARLVLATVLALVLAAFALPPVRAAVLELLRIGTVEIVPRRDDAPTPQPLPTAVRTPAGEPPELRGLAGATTLEQAQQEVSFPIILPHYPAELGPPDRVYIQRLDETAVILAWLDRDGKLRFTLHELPPSVFVQKLQPVALETTTVNGQPALWTQGPYLIVNKVANGEEFGERRLVDQHALIWSNGTMTYRIETALPLEEARKIAESLGSAPAKGAP